MPHKKARSLTPRLRKKTIYDAFVKSPHIVIPAKAGIQKQLILLDRRVKPGDDDKAKSTFYETII